MTSTKYPTLIELEQYHLGTLPQSRCHEIESLALKDHALAEAMEGYEAVPSFEPLPSPDHIFKTKIYSIKTINTKVWWLLNGWTIALITDVLIFMGSAAFLIFIEVPVSTSTPSANSHEETKHDNTIVNANETQLQLNKEVPLDNPVSCIEKEKQDQKPPIIKNEEKADKTNEVASIISPSDVYKYVGVDLKYIGSHKVLDYSEIFKNDFPEVNSFFSKENTKSSRSLTYLEFLTQVLDLYDAQEYNSCRIIFDWLLSEHREDVNAEFFGAMTAHHLGDHVAAKTGFQRVLNSHTPVHKEEARRMLGYN